MAKGQAPLQPRCIFLPDPCMPLTYLGGLGPRRYAGLSLSCRERQVALQRQVEVPPTGPRTRWRRVLIPGAFSSQPWVLLESLGQR